jgi:hypothetical protein
MAPQFKARDNFVMKQPWVTSSRVLFVCLTKCSKFLGVALCLPTILCVNQAQASAFTMGDLVVVRVGDGSAALNSNATATFLDEYTPAGVFVQSIPMPTSLSGVNQPFTLSGSATSEGFLALSQNGLYLTLGGYNALPGMAGVTTAAPTTVARGVARIGLNGVVDTSTSLSDAYSGSNIRSAVSSDGVNIWTGGNAGSGLGATGGPRYTTFGSTTSTRVDTTASNMRVVNIFNGQLYVSSSTGTLLGVSTVGTGLPTTSASSTITPLPGMPTTGTHSSYDFWFKDANTLYVADDGSAANGGGIQKWVLNSGTWSLAYTLGNNGTTTTAVRGLAGTVDGSGNAVLYGTTGGALVSVTDSGSSSTLSTLASAGSNTAFRGVELLVIPEPTTAALTGFGLLALLFFRRFRR